MYLEQKKNVNIHNQYKTTTNARPLVSLLLDADKEEV